MSMLKNLGWRLRAAWKRNGYRAGLLAAIAELKQQLANCQASNRKLLRELNQSEQQRVVLQQEGLRLNRLLDEQALELRTDLRKVESELEVAKLQVKLLTSALARDHAIFEKEQAIACMKTAAAQHVGQMAGQGGKLNVADLVSD